METVILSVPTVHCHACKLNIEEVLDELAGVDTGTVDLATKSSSSPRSPRRSKMPATRSVESDATVALMAVRWYSTAADCRESWWVS
jgi:copper chaperone CopZ